MFSDKDLTINQIETITENLPPSLVAVAVGIAVMIAVLVNVVSDMSLFLWALAASSSFLFRYYVYLKLKKSNIVTNEPNHAKNIIFISATLTGVIWGTASIIFVPQTEMFHWVFLAFFLSGYASGAVFSSSAFMPAFNGYFFSTLLPITIWFYTQSTNHSLLMGVLLTIFTFSAWKMAKNINALLTEKFDMKIQNKVREQKVKALQTMAGGVAHDINNVLAAIIGNTYLAKSNIHNPEKLEQLLNNIEESSNKASLIGKKMLEFSHCNLSPVELIDPNVVFFELKNSHPNINLEISKNIPSIAANKEQFTGITHALIENASEACKQDESKISISVSIIKKVSSPKLPVWENLECDSCLCIKVKDFGCGMGSEEINKACDPFFSTKFTGRGLGLSSVYGIVKSLKGDINIQSRKDFGTTIKILLPVIPE